MQRLLQRLEDKGYVARVRDLGVNAFTPTLSRESYATGQLEVLAERLTGGSLAPMLTRLVEHNKLPPPRSRGFDGFSRMESYASALLRVVDAANESPMLRAPVMVSPASGVEQTGSLERRLKMIVEKNTATAPRWLRTVAWIAVICALPLGTVYCGQPDTAATPDGETTEAPDVVANDAAQTDDSDDASEDRRTARFNQLRRDMRARVAAGEITAEQARHRISRMRQRMEAAGGETAGDRESADQPSEAEITDRINQALRDLRNRLETGEITEEQYNERLAGIRRRQEAAQSEGRGS